MTVGDHTVCTRLIRTAGMRATRGRVRVLCALRAAHAPVCHGELEGIVRTDDGVAIDRVTLYRVLDSLVEAGLAAKSIDGRGVFRFVATESRDSHAGHVHFRCIGCGGIFCLDAPPPSPPALPLGFRLSGMDLDVRGTCGRCSNR
jgi:Fur family ferric uptake transcriptional regulator